MCRGRSPAFLVAEFLDHLAERAATYWGRGRGQEVEQAPDGRQVRACGFQPGARARRLVCGDQVGDEIAPIRHSDPPAFSGHADIAGGVLAELADADGDHARRVAHMCYLGRLAGRTAVPPLADCRVARAVARLVQASAGVTEGVVPVVTAVRRSARPARMLSR